MFEKSIFTNTLTLVTGGGSGIGFAITKKILEHGGTVVIVSRNIEKLETATRNLSVFGDCYYEVMDIRKTDDIARVTNNIKEKYGKLNHLVNNAGGQFPIHAKDLEYKGWNAVINNNLNGTWYVTQKIANDFFINQEGGVIVNIIANIFRGFPGMIHTGAARAGVDNLTKTLAVEWAKYQIRINCIAPGIIRTTGLENYPDGFLRNVEREIPLSTLGTPDDVANLTLFLLSPFSKYITGETVYVDGGLKLWGNIWKLDNPDYSKER